MIAWDGYLDTQTFYASHGQFMFIYYLLIYKHTTYLVFQKCVLLCTWISGDTVNWKLQKNINWLNKGKTIFGSWRLSFFSGKAWFWSGILLIYLFLGTISLPPNSHIFFTTRDRISFPKILSGEGDVSWQSEYPYEEKKKTKYKTTKPYQMFSTELLIFNGMSLANYSYDCEILGEIIEHIAGCHIQNIT